MSDSRHAALPGGSLLDGLIDLAAARLGGRVLAANDEFFAPKENLILPHDAVFDPERYTERGKWMDGWETRRRRTPGYDWCEVALAAPARIHRVVVDTRHFRGNHPSACSLDASREADGDDWRELLPRSDLAGDTANQFEVDHEDSYRRVRLNIFPDGGVARLRVLGEPSPDWAYLAGEGRVDLAAALHGGAPLACSDRFFSDPGNLLMPRPSTHMGDGWETRRRRGPGHDWTIIRLGHVGTIEEVEVDTAHFKGNYPAACSVDGCLREGRHVTDDWSEENWTELLPRSELGPDAVHRFPVRGCPPVSHVRFNIFPDGGVARLRCWGSPRRP